MINDFSRAVAQALDPKFRAILLKGLGLSFGLLVVFTVAMLWVVGFFMPDTMSLPFIGQIDWLGSLAIWTAFIAMIFLSSVLMAPVSGAFIGLFLDEVAQAVEARYYPDLPTVQGHKFATVLRESLGFFAVLLGLNLVALILFFFVGPLAPILFYVVNGYLLGREYFIMAAMRRMSREDAHRLRRRHNIQIWVGGILMAIPLSIPLVNLVIPILGAATFTHMFQRVKG